MIRAQLQGGPFHGHADTVIAAPEWVTVDPACPCCEQPHLVSLDPDAVKPDAPAYRLEWVDSHHARYRYDGEHDDALAALLARGRRPPVVDVDELAALIG